MYEMYESFICRDDGTECKRIGEYNQINAKHRETEKRVINGCALGWRRLCSDRPLSCALAKD